MHKPLLVVIFLLLFTSIVHVQPTHAQNSAITLTLEAGYAGYFRDSAWMPVVVHAANDGDDVSGRLVVRPETSGSGITNTFSTPITLPSGARQTAFLYVTARSFTSTIRVELIDDDGSVIAQREASVRPVQPQDRLNVVISDSPVGSVDLTGVHSGTNNAFQADLALAALPPRALDAVDVILISDTDTGAITSAQRQAVEDWIAAGGHLIVTGGENWQATAAGIVDLLPLTPDASRAIDGLAPVGEWLRADGDLSAQTVIATGSLTPDAQVLVAAADGTPLIARRSFGAGVIDYLAANPMNAPLRGWDGLPALWYALETSTDPQPGWGYGFVDWESAAQAAEIVPGYDPLPDILPLVGFLVLYIGLIGPLNYLILSRLNRREWAWFTTPALILLFSVLAYQLGFNLRGNEATLNRVAVVRAWDGVERAQVDELVGLLSPRRSQYTLTAADSDALRPIPRPVQAAGILTRSTQASIDVREADQFVAQDFSVDASFVAGFHVSGTIPKPEIGGQATFAYDTLDGQQIVRGSVRNDSALTLDDPVILARGVALRLDQPLAPGDLITFDLTLTGENAPAPGFRSSLSTSPYLAFRSASSIAKQSVSDIMGDDYISNITRLTLASSTEEQTKRRRQYFLSSFVDDYYDASGRGDHIYLAGWTDSAPLATEMTGANWNSQDTTLYLVELARSDAAPPRRVTITPEQFTWVVQDYMGVSNVSPVSLTMQAGDEAVIRFTPLPSAVLDQVAELLITTSDASRTIQALPISLWNWETDDWEDMRTQNTELLVRNPARFLGPQNAVQVRITADDSGGYFRIGRVTVAQTGSF